MMDHLILFFKYNKLYFFSGAFLLLLTFLPTKEKISQGARKALYLGLVIWIICFAYRINTGKDIIYLFKKTDNYGSGSSSSSGKIGGPFNKYYSNDAGRTPKTREQ